MLVHLFIRPLGDTHHEEEQAGEADLLHRDDEEEGAGGGVQRPCGHAPQLAGGQRGQAGHVQLLAQPEGKGQQGEDGRHQAAQHQVAHALLHRLHLGDGRRVGAHHGNHSNQPGGNDTPVLNLCLFCVLKLQYKSAQ